MKGHTITLHFPFTPPLPAPPTIRILSPEGATVHNITEKLLVIKAVIKNVHTTFLYKLTVSINDKPQEDMIMQIQFCPACKAVLNNWLQLKADMGNGRAVQFDCCPTCGNVFIPKRVLMSIFEQQKSSIILPGSRGMSMIKGKNN